ncbi:MAG: acyl carrier protein [Lentisphaerae bacterium]|nr:acyl carrier protein [Lentisphaerota bacterium]
MEKFTEEKIKDWLIEEISAITGTEGKLIDPSSSLSQNGISSMGFVELLLGISRQFKIELLNSEISPYDVASVNAFAAKIARTGNQ